jgi:hypothetical protein
MEQVVTRTGTPDITDRRGWQQKPWSGKGSPRRVRVLPRTSGAATIFKHMIKSLSWKSRRFFTNIHFSEKDKACALSAPPAHERLTRAPQALPPPPPHFGLQPRRLAGGHLRRVSGPLPQLLPHLALGRAPRPTTTAPSARPSSTASCATASTSSRPRPPGSATSPATSTWTCPTAYDGLHWQLARLNLAAYRRKAGARTRQGSRKTARKPHSRPDSE